jgi:hypothetical protein
VSEVTARAYHALALITPTRFLGLVGQVWSGQGQVLRFIAKKRNSAPPPRSI